jgi:hypothetical protein
MKNSSRFTHVTYDQAGGARFLLEKPTVTLLVNIHPGFSEVASLILQPKVTQLLDLPTTSEIKN